jgi:SAM-dependent methyltransferase
MPAEPHPCEACGSDVEASLAFHVKGYAIRRCPSCGLLYAEVPGFDAARIYTEDYFQGGAPDGYADYLGSERLLSAEYEARLCSILRHCASGKLLEVGCATGGFLAFARRAFEVEGIDVSAFAVKEARRKGLRVFAGSVLDSDELSPPHDAVALFDTIEHLPAPRATLARLFCWLRPGGVLVLSTGDVTSPLASLMGKRWRLMTPPQHLWFFSRKSLGTLLSRLGFEVRSVEYAWRRVPVSLAWYQLSRGAMPALPAPVGRLLIPVNLFDTMTVIAKKPGAGASAA